MDVGLSEETVKMLEQRLGKGWADAALRGFALTFILAPVIATLLLTLLLLGLVVGVWGWALEQRDRTTWVIMIAALVPVAIIYLATNLIFKWQLNRRYRPIFQRMDEVTAAVAVVNEKQERVDAALTEMEERAALLGVTEQQTDAKLDS